MAPRSSRRWADVSQLLSRACQGMATGQLIHGENFSLFEAMVAIEIMDPKMDSAMAHLTSKNPAPPASFIDAARGRSHESGRNSANSPNSKSPSIQDGSKTPSSATGSLRQEAEGLLFRTAEEAIAAGAAPVQLRPQELLDVLDTLLCLQALWFAGHSLPQTLFSCVYLLCMGHTQHNPVLHAFCRALLATCNTVRGIAIRGNTREEEDFSTTAFGLPLADHSGANCTEALKELEAALGQEEGAQRWEWEGSSHDTTQLRTRVAFLLLCALACCGYTRCRVQRLFDVLEQLDRASAPPDMEKAQELVAAASSALESLQGGREVLQREGAVLQGEAPALQGGRAVLGLSAASDARPGLQSGALPVPSTGAPAMGSSSEGPAAPAPPPMTMSGRRAVGFSSSITFSLMPPAPTRTLPVWGWGDALREYESLLSHLALVCASHSAVHDLPSALNCLAAFHATAPGPLARSAMALAARGEGLLFGGSREEFVARSAWIGPLATRLHLFLSVGSQAALPRGACARAACSVQGAPMATAGPAGGAVEDDGAGGREALDPLRSFAGRAAHALESVLGASCSNASRQRRQLGKCFAEWNAVLQAAHLADTDPRVQEYGLSIADEGWWRSTILVSWTVETVCRCAVHFLLLGFSLELYTERELCPVFWYLEQVLATLLHNGTAREAALREHRATHEGGGTGEGQGADWPGPDSSADVPLLHTYQMLCKATVRMLLALSLDGKMPQRELKFNTGAESFAQRFEVLATVQVPEASSYASFVEGTNAAGLHVPDLLQMAHEYFQTAAAQLPALKLLCERQLRKGRSNPLLHLSWSARAQEIEQLQRLLLRNLTALQVAHRAGAGATLKASFDFSTHPYFPIVALRRP